MLLLFYTVCAFLFLFIGWIFGHPAWEISLGAGAGMFLAGVIIQIFWYWYPRRSA